jgi:putative transposase
MLALLSQPGMSCPDPFNLAVPLISRILGISSSGHYAWYDRPSRRAQENLQLEIEIKAAHKRTKQTYSSERLQPDLASIGVKAGICRIKKIRKKLGIRYKQKRTFKAMTYSKHNLPVAENILEQKFEVRAPNKVWLSDITYVPTDEGWLYLAAHKDLFYHEIVGYAMGDRMPKNLVTQSLFRAVEAKRPGKGTAMTMLRWKASGACSSKNLSTRCILKRGRRLKRPLPNI